MNIFEIIDGEVSVIPAARMIKQVRLILERDKGSKGDSQGRKKLKANKELAFVYFYCSKSHYVSELDEQRIKKIIRDLELEDWKPDELVWDCVNYYLEGSETVSGKTLRILYESLLTFIDVTDEIRKRTTANLNAIKNIDIHTLNKEQLQLRDVAISSCSKDIETILDFAQKVPKAIDNVENTRKKLEAESKSTRVVGGKTPNRWDN